MRIAVLALQGAFAEHRKMLQTLGVESFEVRQAVDWEQPKDGLILPGGESTVQSKLLKELHLLDALRQDICNGLPVFGTCAGLILLAQHVENDVRERLGTMHITVKRNAYGRQTGSFFTEDNFAGQTIPMSFIRAPYISEVENDVEVLATVDGHIVAAQQGCQLVTAFHPELLTDTTVHRYFLSIVKENKDRLEPFQ
ncbi:pyridoxal 5'-phosphate synthase glutaminase subunit PdxT [Segatella oulorum]|uniref:pyridoxal 5'-phosphate synthase glutaminase subunit PdxT n=1 Tax=Segatella oulorum TaxID=28136 RepID=UPI0028E9171D|nr:pyridoxal 5'-phosphate synthase glutaminase subunit PdxT [Segatella oulorum]